jgi:hypothetical protein
VKVNQLNPDQDRRNLIVEKVSELGVTNVKCFTEYVPPREDAPKGWINCTVFLWENDKRYRQDSGYAKDVWDELSSEFLANLVKLQIETDLDLLDA